MITDNRSATIYDIAREAGVSASTVSLAFSGKRPIRDSTRRRIHDIARDLGYQPNHAARALVARRTQSVAVLVNRTTNFSTATSIDSIDKALSDRGYQMLLMLTHGKPDRIDRVMETLGAGRVDGVLNLEPTLETPDIAQCLPNMAIVTMIRDEQTPAVVRDCGEASRLAVEYLAQQGHKRIGLIHGKLSELGARQHQEGFILAMRAAGLPMDPKQIVEADWSMDHAQALAPSVLATGVTAIVAAGDMIAAGLIRGCRLLGKSVPEDVSILGFDNSPIAALIDPPLTSIHMCNSQIIDATVEALIRRIEGKPQQPQIKVAPQLIERRSTTPPQH